MPDTLGLRRQDYPRGTPEGGQYVQAGQYLPVTEPQIDWLEYETLTVSTTVTQLAQRLVGWDVAFITVETAAIRYRVDSNAAPSATVGHPLEVGDVLTLSNADEIKNARFIRRDGVDGVLQVSYGRRLAIR